MVVETVPKPAEPHLSEALTEILQTAEETARGYNHPYVGSEHILIAFATSEQMADIFGQLKVKPEEVQAAVESYLKGVAKRSQTEIGLTYRVENIKADITQDAANAGRSEITPVDLFRGIVGDKETAAAQILKPLKVTAGRLKKV